MRGRKRKSIRISIVLERGAVSDETVDELAKLADAYNQINRKMHKAPHPLLFEKLFDERSEIARRILKIIEDITHIREPEIEVK